MVIDDFKIDFRIYVAVTQVFPTFQILIFRDGVTRFASEKYSTSPESVNSANIHLCNNAVNRIFDEHINDKNWTVLQVFI
jgi:tubulin polyglutamylase TTLL4